VRSTLLTSLRLKLRRFCALDIAHLRLTLPQPFRPPLESLNTLFNFFEAHPSTHRIQPCILPSGSVPTLPPLKFDHPLLQVVVRKLQLSRFMFYHTFSFFLFWPACLLGLPGLPSNCEWPRFSPVPCSDPIFPILATLYHPLPSPTLRASPYSRSQHDPLAFVQHTW
jgi:hypothetical protein